MRTTFNTFILLGALGAVLCACTQSDIRQNHTSLRGFNLLQDDATTLNSSQACTSLQNLSATGANSVILIPFLQQDSAQATQLRYGTQVTDAELGAAIQHANQQGLYTVIKPQILVPQSWAGAISFNNTNDEEIWFQSYQHHLLHFAQLAENRNADAFIIGTELKQLGHSHHWAHLIQSVRKVFSGELSYAAHNLDGVESFAHWQALDRIGITLYPALPAQAKAREVAQITSSITQTFATLANRLGKPAWIMEIGIPSAQGWETHPWMWQDLHNAGIRSDPNLQGRVLGQWLQSINNTAIQGVWIWQWSSSPDAGGHQDVGYTVQNKFSQTVIERHWRTTYPGNKQRGEAPCG